MWNTDAWKQQAAGQGTQTDIRITAGQERLLKQYCVRNDVTTQDAVIKALQGLIDCFMPGRRFR